MHGATLKSKPYYRCNSQHPDYTETGHPRTTAIREERILAALGRARTGRVASPVRRNATLATRPRTGPMGHPTPLFGRRRQMRRGAPVRHEAIDRTGLSERADCRYDRRVLYHLTLYRQMI